MLNYLLYYPLISLFMCLIYIIKAKNMDIKLDPIEALKKIDNMLNELKEKYERLGELLIRIVNSALEGNRIALYILIYTLFLIPILRWILFIQTLIGGDVNE